MRMGVVDEELRLLGPRVVLRPVAVSDAAAVFAYSADPAVTRFLSWDPPPSRLSVQPYLEEQTTLRRCGSALTMAIELRAPTPVDGPSPMIGMIGTVGLSDLRGGCPELGCLLARPCWNRGLMTEAASLLVAYGLGPLHLPRLHAWVDHENEASRRVLEKIGMRMRGSEIRVVKEQKRLYMRYEIGQVG